MADKIRRSHYASYRLGKHKMRFSLDAGEAFEAQCHDIFFEESADRELRGGTHCGDFIEMEASG
jgi:hypothetical protein